MTSKTLHTDLHFPKVDHNIETIYQKFYINLHGHNILMRNEATAGMLADDMIRGGD